jgi:hypothetical protein
MQVPGSKEGDPPKIKSRTKPALRVCLETSLPEQEARDHAVHHLQRRRDQLRLRGRQQA